MKKALIVSPHLDDSVLSCGDLIDKYIKENYIVDVLTVFSGKCKKELLSSAALKFHSNCFLNENAMIYRKKEDCESHKLLGCNSYYLDMYECLYRMFENEYLYPDLGNIYHFDERDAITVKELEIKLLEYVSNYDIVLGPLGLGNHADHLVVNKAINNIKHNINGKLYFYEEVAYVCYYYRSNELSNWGKNLSNELIEISEENFEMKVKAIMIYRSQLNILWENYDQMYNDLDSFSKKYDKERKIRLWHYDNL